MPSWFKPDSDEANAHNQVTGGHKGSISHELLVSAATFAATHAYEKHVESQGKPLEHGKAIEFAAAAAGGFIDHIFETKGLDAIDRAKAKHEAEKRAKEQLAQQGQL